MPDDQCRREPVPAVAGRARGRRWRRGPAAPPVPPRDAATVVLLRDGAGGPEVYLLRRHGRMAFAAGQAVFPGGGVDPRDGEADVGWAGPDRRPTWADRLPLRRGHRAGAGLRRRARDLRGVRRAAGRRRRRHGRRRHHRRGWEADRSALESVAGVPRRPAAPPRAGAAQRPARRLGALDHPRVRAAPLRHPVLRRRAAGRTAAPATCPASPSRSPGCGRPRRSAELRQGRLGDDAADGAYLRRDRRPGALPPTRCRPAASRRFAIGAEPPRLVVDGDQVWLETDEEAGMTRASAACSRPTRVR